MAREGAGGDAEARPMGDGGAAGRPMQPHGLGNNVVDGVYIWLIIVGQHQ